MLGDLRREQLSLKQARESPDGRVARLMSFRQPEREGAFPSRSPPLDAPIIEAEGCGAWGWPAYFGQDASGNVLVQAQRWQLPQQPPDRYRGIGGRHGLRRTTGKGETSNLASNIKLHT